MKLYYVPRSSAARPRWMLEEIGAPYELVRLDPAKNETRTPEHLALHPLGHVPVLVDGDTTLFESAAIVQHLADRFPDARLAPALGTTARAHYYQWFSFCMTELTPTLFRYLRHTQMLPEDQRDAKVAEEARKLLPDMLAAVETLLSQQAHVLGPDFTAADIMITGSLGIAKRAGLLKDRPVLDSYVERMTSRPAWQRAMAD